MKVELKHQPSYSLAVVTLAPNEQVKAESSSMVSFSDGVNIETKSEGGLLGGLKRAVTGESFFQNTFSAPAQGGEVTFAPSLPGDMKVIQMGGGGDFLLQSGAYIASELNLTMDTKWGGAKGFFGSGSLLLIKVSGQGQLLIGCYGSMEERVLAPGQKYNVDTGHIVGFDASVSFQVKRVGGWKSTIFSGEGLICELTGPGRVLMQTRSEEAFLGWLIPHLPTKSS
jgi:uncharacterized protein (TIGR00266 family)